MAALECQRVFATSLLKGTSNCIVDEMPALHECCSCQKWAAYPIQTSWLKVLSFQPSFSWKNITASEAECCEGMHGDGWWKVESASCRSCKSSPVPIPQPSISPARGLFLSRFCFGHCFYALGSGHLAEHGQVRNSIDHKIVEQRWWAAMLASLVAQTCGNYTPMYTILKYTPFYGLFLSFLSFP